MAIDTLTSPITPNGLVNKVNEVVEGIPTKTSDLTNDSGFTTNTGTVTQVATGAGLTGGPITENGTIKAALKNENLSRLTASSMTSVSGKQYAVGLDADGDLSVNIPWTDSNYYGAFYATCKSASSAQHKLAELADNTGWSLRPGLVVGVKFTNTNTYTPTTSFPVTLNIHGTGAKNIYYDNTATPTGSDVIAFGRADCINYYMYDGTYWVWLSTSADADSLIDLGAYYTSSQVDNLLANKVTVESGKGLSTNDYTTTEKDKLAAIESGAEVNIIETVKVNGTTLTPTNKAVDVTVPTKTSDLTNDINFVSDSSYVHTDNNFTTTLKDKLDGIANGAEVNVQPDWSVTNTSSDAYIKNKPSIPTKTSDLTNDSGFITDAGVTSFNGSTGAVTYTAPVTSVNGDTGDVTVSVPTKTSDLTNDSGFTTNTGTVTSVATGAGLSGGTITGSGTIKAALQDETQSALTAAAMGSTSNRQYAVGLDAEGNLSVNVPWIYSDNDHCGTFYGTCTTVGSTAAKVVTLSNTVGWSLRPGSVVGVKFTYTNTYSATTTSHVTLNVNNTGAKSIYYGTNLPAGTSTIAFGTANYVTYYMYDGTYWVWLGRSTESTYPTMTQSLASTGTSTNGYLISPKVLVDTIHEKSTDKYTETNPALTATSGVCTWTVTHSLNTRACVVDVTQTTSPYKSIVCEVRKTTVDTVDILIKSDTDIVADSYEVTIIG